MRPADREPSEATTTYNVLFVCTGNTCRSPMAEAVARAQARERGWQHVRIASAGVAADEGAPASPHACTVLRRRGLDAGAHRARQLSPELVAWADLVLVMSPPHLEVVEALGGADKVALLGHFAAGGQGGYPVVDPFGAGEPVYQRTLQQLDELVRAALDRLAPIVHP